MGSGKDNTNFLACCSAAETLMPPLFICEGTNLWTTWKGNADLPGTMYVNSEKVYMTSGVFKNFFAKICEQVKQRPLLFILDGHTTHLSIKVLEKAKNEQISVQNSLHTQPKHCSP